MKSVTLVMVLIAFVLLICSCNTKITQPFDSGHNTGNSPFYNVVCSPDTFSVSTTISYSLKFRTSVRVDILNLRGQLIKTLVNGSKSIGTYHITWNGTDSDGHQVYSGAYFYKMSSGKYSITKRVFIIR